MSSRKGIKWEVSKLWKWEETVSLDFEEDKKVCYITFHQNTVPVVKLSDFELSGYIIVITINTSPSASPFKKTNKQTGFQRKTIKKNLIVQHPQSISHSSAPPSPPPYLLTSCSSASSVESLAFALVLLGVLLFVELPLLGVFILVPEEVEVFAGVEVFVLVAGAFVPVGVGILFALDNALEPALVTAFFPSSFLPLLAVGFVTLPPRTVFRGPFAPFAPLAVFGPFAILAGAFLMPFLGAGASSVAAAAFSRWRAVTLRVPGAGRRHGEFGWSVR
jgi:hypothetical protein